MWGQLHNAWSQLERPKGEPSTWKKGNQLFEAFIEQIEPQKFLFVIAIPDSGEELYEQVMGIATLEDAMYEGNKLIFEFLAMGVEMLGNLRLTTERPHNEVRLKQIILTDKGLAGIDEEGVVYKQGDIYDKDRQPGAKKLVWIKQTMERFGE